MANIPPPDNLDEGFAFTYAPENPVIDIKELRYLILTKLMDNGEIRTKIQENHKFSYTEAVTNIIIPAAIRIEEYVNSGK